MSSSTAGLGASVAKKLEKCSLLDRCIGALPNRWGPAKRESGACNLPGENECLLEANKYPYVDI